MTTLRWSSGDIDDLLTTPRLVPELSGAAGVTLALLDHPPPKSDLTALTQRGFVVASVGTHNASADLVIDEHEVEALTARCAASPVASSVAMQQLRLAEQLPPAAALVTESLAYATLQAGPEHRRWCATNATRRRVRPENTDPAVLVNDLGSRVELVVNRPKLQNPLTTEMRNRLVELIDTLALRTDLESIEISGAGSNFCIGGDLAEFGLVDNSASAHLIRTASSVAQSLIACPVPVTFSLHGACVGAGVELAAFGDEVTAAPNTTFSLPEVDLGLIPGAGGTVSLTNRIGRQRAARLLLVEHRFDAAEALRIGLIDRIVDQSCG